MKDLFDLLFLLTGVCGLALSFASRSQLTDEGRSTPWYNRLIPIWNANPYFSPSGQVMVRISGILISGSVLLLIASRFVN